MATIETYTTSDKIRDDSGFNNNSYILDTAIDSQRIRAYGVINSYVGTKYLIPNLEDSNFIGSPAAVLLESIEILLGGAYMLIKEYGSEGRDTDKDGYRREADARQMLKQIQTGEISLLGNDSNKLISVAAKNSAEWRIRGYIPEESPRFSVNDTF